MEIKRLTLAMDAERIAVARIHLTELPDSGLAVLGEKFLYHFYYGSLLEDPDYFCFLCLVNGTVAGFTVFCTDSRGVCRRAIARRWPSLTRMIAAELIRQPARFVAFFKLARSFFSVNRSALEKEIKAEAMSTAVTKFFRDAEYFRRTGTHVSQALYFTLARVLCERGAKKVKGFTRKSNVFVEASLTFLGWEKISCTKETCLWVWDTALAAKKFNLVVA